MTPTCAAALAAALFLALIAGPVRAVQFGSLTDLQTGIGFTTVLALGPEDPDPLSRADGCIYAVHGSNGTVSRVCFDAAKTVTSNSVVIDINGAGSVNNVLGIAIDPDSDPAGEIHVYLGYSDDNGGPFQGKIARAVSSDGGVSFTTDEDFITGLGRSAFNHQTNGLDFGPDNCLYISQGNNSNAGYDSAYAESRLSSAALRVCFKDSAGGVDPAFDRNCGGGNSQQACGVEVFASGIRNPYDIVWHSNGRLYNTDNDANQGFRDNCGAEANNFGCPCQVPPVEPIGDEINLIEQGMYYGSPNPYRANPSGLQCNGGTDGGDSCASDGNCGGGGLCQDLSAVCTDGVCGEQAQCYYFGWNHGPEVGEDPNGVYRAPLAQIGALLDGLTEYRARFDGRGGGSFCSDWNGDLLATGGPGSVRRFDVAPDGLAVTDQGSANLSGASGLDVVVGHDGTIYTADLNAGKISYIEPVTQSNPLAADYFDFCTAGDVCTAGACEADGDNDGLGDSVDPCPVDSLNRCAGPVATDGNTGNPIRVNANTGVDSCSGNKTDCNGDTWFADFGYNVAANAFACSLAGGCPLDATGVFGCTDAATEDLFKCEHWDSPQFPELTYSFDIPDGDYVINLLFMNAFDGTSAVGARVFDILIENATEYPGFDQVAAAGGSGIPVVRSALVTVSDGDGLQIELGHQNADNPAIKGIEVLQVFVQPECVVDADCNDLNVCTDDTCSAGVCANAPNTAGCDDGVSCTSGDICAGSVCSGVGNCAVGEVCNAAADVCEVPSVQIRINVNGAAYTGVDYPGSWAADPGAGGVCTPNAFATGNAISGTVDDVLFQGEVWGNPLTCQIDDGGQALPAGDYQVNLYFVEIFHGPGCQGGGAGTGSRVFDIALEGTTVETGVDIFSEGLCAASTSDPNGTPVVKSYTVAVGDGTLDISMPATVDNAKISAIEVLALGAPECVANPDCDDSDVCSDDVCVSGVCQYNPNTAPCDDGISCTSGDVCAAGACGGSDSCPSGSSCDPFADVCVVAPPSFQDFADTQQATNATSITLATPPAIQPDDLLIATVTTDGGHADTLVPPGGEGWTQIALDAEGAAVTLGVWWKLAGAAESPTHVFSWSGAEQAYGYILRFTGHDLAFPIEASATQGGTSATPTAPGITSNFDTALIVRIGGFDDDDVTVGDAGMTGHTTITMNESGTGAASASSGAAQAPRGGSASVPSANFTLTATEQWRSVSLAIRPAPTTTVPTEVQMPGTQPGELANEIAGADDCSLCHRGYAQDAIEEPSHGWGGSMMAHASRDPLFWGAMAVAEQDFAGSGDLCLRCHVPKGWLAGRSEPTDGSALLDSDADGVQCDLCHRLTNPDGSEHIGLQTPPFVANDGGIPAAGFVGSGQYVIWDQTTKLGPYNDASAPHGFMQSSLHRDSDVCGTCHDVSNPVTGDLAHNNGAQVPLAPGQYSGVPGAPVEQKAAFLNFPHEYGVVERTFSEYKAGLLSQTAIADYLTLPANLQAGAIQAAYDAALLAGTGGNYEDGTARTFTCQACHMKATAAAEGCSLSPPLRDDLPTHDLTGGNYWVPDAIQYLDSLGQLRLGGGLNATENAELDAGQLRARQTLSEAASLSVTGDTLTVVNLTGHKLITGYPEGRRMWLNVKWFDAGDVLIDEVGAYGTLSVLIDGVPTNVDSILDLADPDLRTYEAHHAVTQEWATQLLGMGLSPTLPLSYDRLTGSVDTTLADVAAQAPGTWHETSHFVLNNTTAQDTRIPPYGMTYDDARSRNALPVPADQYGNPGPGGSYDYWDEVVLIPPPGADQATIDLLYQPTSWEYIQFLYEANTGSNAFLQEEGNRALDAWLNTGMAAPHTMASTVWSTACGDGVFDVGEECDNGANNGTPGQCCSAACTFEPIASECRGSAGACDVAETCTGSSGSCPADVLVAAASECRASAGVCDVAEACDGVVPICPADGFAAATIECRASVGLCDVAELCSGTGEMCPSDILLSAAAECRAGSGVCDVAEVCDGMTPTCPADVFLPMTSECRASSGACDVAEQCPGTGATCPVDAFLPPSTACRGAVGVCDDSEFCDGESAGCGADAKLTGECRPAIDLCDAAESCDGVGDDCPTDELEAFSTVCRVSAGVCDILESCTGSDPACPADSIEPGNTICRASSGACDPLELCDGVTTECPANVLEPATSVCRPLAGLCDVEESCTGSSAACPADGFQSASVGCRGTSGSCDLQESCSGFDVLCPVDSYASPTTACRPQAFLCDLEELCTGADAFCPSDQTLNLGDPCEDGDACTNGEECLGGLVCGGGVSIECDDGNLCTADSCDSVSGCGHAVIPGCPPDLPASSSWGLAVLGFLIVATGALLSTRRRGFGLPGHR